MDIFFGGRGRFRYCSTGKPPNGVDTLNSGHLYINLNLKIINIHMSYIMYKLGSFYLNNVPNIILYFIRLFLLLLFYE